MPSHDLGKVLFKTRDVANDWAELLDRDGVRHGPVKRIDVGYDPDEVRQLGVG